MSISTQPSEAADKVADAHRSSPEPDSHGQAPGSQGSRPGIGRRLLGALPNVIVFGVLVAIALVGRRNDWKLPKYSELWPTGSAEGAAGADWCDAHGVPESICIECATDSFPRSEPPVWCKEHGVHECTLCHPEVAQLKETPTVTDENIARAARALRLRDRPENNSLCKLFLRRIQFSSKEAVAKAGVDIDLVQERAIEEAIVATGEIVYDQTRLARLSSRATGSAWRVLANVGDRVRKGRILALVDAAEVGRVKAEFLRAFSKAQSRNRILKKMRSAGEGVPRRQIDENEALLQEAQASVVSARQALDNLGLPLDPAGYEGKGVEPLATELRFLGLPSELGKTLATETSTANLLPIRSPIDGIVVERHVVTGEMVDPAETLFVIVDRSRMWLELNVALEDAPLVSVGRKVRFEPDGGGPTVTGTINWISSQVDNKTRTVAVRADLDNPDGRLRDETFGQGRIVLREEPKAIVVPDDAVQWDGSCHVVFVRDKDYFADGPATKVFHTRSVRVGVKDDGFTEVIAGAWPGEVVATVGADILRGELLKNNLGAG